MSNGKFPPDLPIITETTFDVAANGESGPTKLSDLINQYRMPMWVDEIRISARTGDADPVFWSVFTRTKIRILFGRYAITNEFVPGNVLAPRWPGDGHIVIRLHKPLYITPQDLPVPTVRSEVALNVRFSLTGRLAQPLPKNSKIWVPYITAFQGTNVTAGSTSSQESNRTALANPFRVPLTVRFLLGWRTAFSSRVVDGTANNQPPINVRISNHLGRPIVRDPTPFFDLFNIRDQTWSVNAVLPVGGYFLANTSIDATDAVETQKYNIGMFGYREESVQWSI
jgi:hypothetical protein